MSEKPYRYDDDPRFFSDADWEARGMPRWFKNHGYFATEEQKRMHSETQERQKEAIKQARDAAISAQTPKEIREAVRLLCLDHLHKALQSGLNRDAMSHVIAAIKELEKQ